MPRRTTARKFLAAANFLELLKIFNKTGPEVPDHSNSLDTAAHMLAERGEDTLCQVESS